MFEWIRILLCGNCEQKTKELNDKINTYRIENGQLYLSVEKLENTIKEKETEIGKKDTKIQELATQIVVPDPQEFFWNSKYPKQNITYSGRCLPNQTDRTFEVDVRVYFTPYDQQLTDIVNRSWIGIGKLNEGTNDEKALKCLKWVRANFTYDSDKTVTGLSEFWMFPFEALKYKRGDCDDGSLLLANLLLVAGVPYWRIRENCGDVNGGGHCYTTFCRETDNQFCILDWCYDYTDKPVKDRPLHKDERDYYGIWFSFNQHFAFGKMDTMAGMPKSFISNNKKAKS